MTQVFRNRGEQLRQRGTKVRRRLQGQAVNLAQGQESSRVAPAPIECNHLVMLDPRGPVHEVEVQPPILVQGVEVDFSQTQNQVLEPATQRGEIVVVLRRQQTAELGYTRLQRPVGMKAEPDRIELLGERVEPRRKRYASRISKSWVMDAVAPSMIDAEQYLSALRRIARST